MTTCAVSGSIPSKAFPFHSILHSLASFPLRNFISTIYRLLLSVLIILKWLTSSLVLSPTKPRKSDGVRYEGTASIHSVVQSSSLNAGCSASSFRCNPLPALLFLPVVGLSYNPGVSSPSRYSRTTPHPSSSSSEFKGSNRPLVARPLGPADIPLLRSVSRFGKTSLEPSLVPGAISISCVRMLP